MSLLFLLPFGTGGVYTLRNQSKTPVEWKYPLSILTTSAIMHSFRAFSNVEEFSVKHVRQMPAALFAASVWQGSVFCLGHLFTKMTYPLVNDN